MRRLNGALALLMIAPIGLAKEYVAPTQPPLATLTIQNKTPGSILPVTFSNPKKCSGMLMLAKGPLWLGKRIQQVKESVIVAIDASKEFTLFVESTSGSSEGISSCRIIYTFNPEEGRQYIATSSTDGQSCSLTLERESIDASGAKSLETELTARRRELPGFTMSGFGPQCKEEAAAAK
jgi:hypothetical protein